MVKRRAAPRRVRAAAPHETVISRMTDDVLISTLAKSYNLNTVLRPHVIQSVLHDVFYTSTHCCRYSVISHIDLTLYCDIIIGHVIILPKKKVESRCKMRSVFFFMSDLGDV